MLTRCFFKMFPTRILEGNADEVLAKPYYCLVSRTMAERMGGNVIGRKLGAYFYSGTDDDHRRSIRGLSVELFFFTTMT